MEGVPSLRHIMEREDCICKIELNYAYVVISIHNNSRQYITYIVSLADIDSILIKIGPENKSNIVSQTSSQSALVDGDCCTAK